MLPINAAGHAANHSLDRVDKLSPCEADQVGADLADLQRPSGDFGGFLSRVLNGPKVFVKGDEDGLRELAQ